MAPDQEGAMFALLAPSAWFWPQEPVILHSEMTTVVPAGTAARVASPRDPNDS
jgi:hypothetical protein